MTDLVVEIEKTFKGEYPIRNADFAIAMLRCIQLAERKNRDYADGDDPYSNFNQAVEMGVAPHVGVALRLGDKWKRFTKFIKKGDYAVIGETFQDTCDDLTNYAQICKLLYMKTQPNPYPPLYSDTDNNDVDRESLKVRQTPKIDGVKLKKRIFHHERP